MIDKMEKFRESIIAYMKTAVSDGTLHERSYYGECFAALSLLLTGRDEDTVYAEIYLKLYKEKDKNVENFHWEFNNYALMKIRNLERVKNINTYLYPLRFKGTSCTNWTLLRAVCMAMEGNVAEADEICGKKAAFAQEESGLIKDEENVESLQYHAFSTLLLFELFELTGKEIYRERFLRAVMFASDFVLSNGCSLYIGRGQEQIFGYGCLLYIFSQGYLETGSVKLISCLNRIVKYIGLFYKDGEKIPLPLVLNHLERDSQKSLNPKDIRHPGWYPYNNYSDYITFFCYYLSLSINLLKTCCTGSALKYATENIDKENFKLKDNRFLIAKTEKYEAVIAAGGGYWTNDLQFPLIVSAGNIMTPCYGGEQYAKSIYSREQIPMPWGRISYPYGAGVVLIKNCIKYIIRLYDKRFILRSSTNARIYKSGEKTFCLKLSFEGVKFQRIFTFENDRIEVEDWLEFNRTYFFKTFYFLNLWFFENIEETRGEINKYNLSPQICLEILEERKIQLDDSQGYCAIGFLKNLKIAEHNIRIKKGSKYVIKYKVLFL